MFRQGAIFKNDQFSQENEYLDLVQVNSLELNSSKNGHDSLLQQKMHHNEVESKARNVAHHSWESQSILNGEQPEAVEDSEVALNDPGCIARAHPTAALSY